MGYEEIEEKKETPDGTENGEDGLRNVSFITHLRPAHICEHKYKRLCWIY